MTETLMPPLWRSRFPADLLDRFTPLSLLGQGGMGQVVLCRDASLEREVAVKLLLAPGEPALEKRFLREAEAMARVNHPSILEIYDNGILPTGVPYLVMEALEGVPLDKAVGKLDCEKIVIELSDALDTLHQAGLIHRDVKPSNIFLTKDGRSVLLDFGLIRNDDQELLTRTGAAVGTPLYMAPEALRGESPTPAFDWYGLGATLFYLLEGQPPYSLDQVLARYATSALPPLQFDLTSEEDPRAHVARRLLADIPKERPHSRRELEEIFASGAPVRRATPRAKLAVTVPLPKDPEAPLGGTAAAPLPRWVVGLWAALPLAAIAAALYWFGVPVPLAPLPKDRSERLAPALEASRMTLQSAGLERLPDNPQGYRRFRNQKDGSFLILVPGGKFHSRAQSDLGRAKSVREVDLAPYLFGETAVTVAQWSAFWKDKSGLKPGGWKAQSPYPENPVTWMKRERAREYCRWAGGRLPTTTEFERAAAGLDGRTYPWGETPPTPEFANFGATDFTLAFTPEAIVRPVRSYPLGISPIGAYELCGNTASWSEDELPVSGRPDLRQPARMGGTFLSGEKAIVTWVMRTWPADGSGSGIGLRLVRPVSSALELVLQADR